jgi:hypothetical protein
LCRGGGICEHGNRRYDCKECGGGAICEHGRQRRRCKECGGSTICEHGRDRYYCKECGGGGICEHGKRHDRCKVCRAGGKRRRRQPAHEASEPAAERHGQTASAEGGGSDELDWVSASADGDAEPPPISKKRTPEKRKLTRFEAMWTDCDPEAWEYVVV